MKYRRLGRGRHSERSTGRHPAVAQEALSRRRETPWQDRHRHHSLQQPEAGEAQGTTPWAEQARLKHRKPRRRRHDQWRTGRHPVKAQEVDNKR